MFPAQRTFMFSRLFSDAATYLPRPLSGVFNDAAAHFERFEVKKRLFKELQQELNDGTIDHLEAAKRIAYSVHANMTRRNGKPYITHVEAVVDAPNRYADINYTDIQVMLAWVHDVPEDSKGAWKVRDFKKLGFPREFLQGLDGITHRRGEKYLDYIERLSRTPVAIVKVGDNRHNWMDRPKPEKAMLYRVSSHYLLAREVKKIPDDMNIAEWAAQEGMYNEDLFDKHSSRPLIRNYRPPAGRAHMASIPAPVAL